MIRIAVTKLSPLREDKRHSRGSAGTSLPVWARIRSCTPGRQLEPLQDSTKLYEQNHVDFHRPYGTVHRMTEMGFEDAFGGRGMVEMEGVGVTRG